MAAGHAFPARDEVIFLVYCVVLGTLIVPSFTLKALVRRLGLGQEEELRRQELEARAKIAHAALAKLEEVAEADGVPEDLLGRLRGMYELRLSRLEAGRRDLEGDNADADHDATLERLRVELVAAQRRALRDLRTQRLTASEVIGRIQRDIDLEETRLRPLS